MEAEVRVIDSYNPFTKPYLIEEHNVRIEGCVEVHEFRFEYRILREEYIHKSWNQESEDEG